MAVGAAGVFAGRLGHGQGNGGAVLGGEGIEGDIGRESSVISSPDKRLIGAFISHLAGLGKCLVSVVVSPAGGEMNRLRKALSVKVSSLVTTNLPFDEWTDVFGSERLTGALLDRLTHHVHILEMNGDSYRLKGSRQNTGSPSPDQPAAA